MLKSADKGSTRSPAGEKRLARAPSQPTSPGEKKKIVARRNVLELSKKIMKPATCIVKCTSQFFLPFKGVKV